MVFNIKNVVVDKISLISRGKKPAVSQAETRFSIFKVASKPILSPESINKLESISKGYEEIIKILDETENEFRYRIKQPNLFDQNSFRRITIQEKSPKVYGIVGKLKGESNTTLQALRFEKKDKWDKKQVQEWVKAHKDIGK